MDLFQFLNMIGGLSLFLFGMNLMGQALERRAGSGMRTLLSRMTTGKAAGFLTGCGVTAVIQSSSATTVMVVGFVNSGLMTLRQAIHVIMGANVGTTVTAWILSLGGISGDSIVVQLLKPTSFTPVMALIGVVLLLFSKSSKKKDSGTILLGFAVLMFGMDAMTGAVSGLAEVPAFRELFLMFRNPLLGLLAGAVLTGIIQSSSASVGILQALAATGQVPFSAAIPIIMGQNIGTCVTALLSSVGANRNARRAAFVHLSFNIIGSTVLLIVFSLVQGLFHPTIFAGPADQFNIAIAHTAFNLLCVAMLTPASQLLEKLAMRVIPDTKEPEKNVRLDERLLATPPLALAQCEKQANSMAEEAVTALEEGLQAFETYTPALAEEIRRREDKTDRAEDRLGNYLIRLSAQPLSQADSEEAAKLLKVIGDFERIADHAVNLLDSAEELRGKQLAFSEAARRELSVLTAAVREVLQLALTAFTKNDLEAAFRVEPLKEVIDGLKEQLRTRHILRLQKGECQVETGFVWSDLLTSLERAADHSSNIAGCVIDADQHRLDLHQTLRAVRQESEDFRQAYRAYVEKYALS
ncbi:MAG: Na/Pi cotransporter family protein [Clostridia bacterium]|nr:Na/Pi cotransporter family protein [Clostridia bacterium]